MADNWEMIVDIRSSAIDEVEVRRALGLIIDSSATHEIRALPSGKSRIIQGNALDLAVKAIGELGDSKGIYVTLNPARSTLDKSANDKDILYRRRFLIDCDPSRPSRDTNATDEEKEASRIVMEATLSDLDSRGWPRPIVIDSGNGWHLLYSIDLPCDEISRLVIRDCLRKLNKIHGTKAAQIDCSTFNASRITKLPGTWARKGAPSPERPYRMARLVTVPAVFLSVEIEQLQELAYGTFPQKEEKKEEVKVNGQWDIPIPSIESRGIEAYVRKAVEGECGKVATARDGERNNVLNVAAFCLGTLLHFHVVDRQDIETQLTEAARRAGLVGSEVEKTIRSGIEAGLLEPRPSPNRMESTKPHEEKIAQIAADPSKKMIVWASQIVPKKVKWLWPKRIPLGKMTTFAGPGGIGKSFVLCDIASRVSAGLPWPFCGGECPDPGNVLFISGEDDEDDTLVPRLIECGADLTRIAFPGEEAHEAFNLTDLSALSALSERMIEERSGDIRLVIIDPPTTYLDEIDNHKDSELRTKLFGPMKRWVAKHQVALIFNNHVNKGSGNNIEAAARVMGSVAWVNAVRIAHMFIKDKEDEDKVLFVPFKVNIGKRQKALIYRIKETRDDLAKIEWIGEAETTANEALGNEARKPATKDAREWIIEMFNKSKEWPSDLWWAELKIGGITEHRFNQVRAILDIPKARRVSCPNGDITWIWWVPDDWPFFDENKITELRS